MTVSGRFGSRGAGGRVLHKKPRAKGRVHQVRADHRDGVHHIHHTDGPGERDHRLAVRSQTVDQGEAQQRTVAARAPAIDPRHHAEQRGRGELHQRDQRPGGVRPDQVGDGGRSDREDLNITILTRVRRRTLIMNACAYCIRVRPML